MRLLTRPPPSPRPPDFFLVFDVFFDVCVFLGAPKTSGKYVFVCFVRFVFMYFAFFHLLQTDQSVRHASSFHFVGCCLLAYTFLCNDWKPYFNMSTSILFFAVLLLCGFLDHIPCIKWHHFLQSPYVKELQHFFERNIRLFF